MDYLECVEDDRSDWWDMFEVLEKEPLLGPMVLRWLAGFTVTIRLLELATIMSVT